MDHVENKKSFRWHGLEYEAREKSGDWFWALGIVALAGAATAIILGNVLFGIVIILGAGALALYAARPPRELSFEIHARGITIGKTLYPFSSLSAFWVDTSNTRGDPKLLVASKQAVLPLVVIPLTEVSPEGVREFLLSYLPEEELEEPLSHKLMELLGF